MRRVAPHACLFYTKAENPEEGKRRCSRRSPPGSGLWQERLLELREAGSETLCPRGGAPWTRRGKRRVRGCGRLVM